MHTVYILTKLMLNLGVGPSSMPSCRLTGGIMSSTKNGIANFEAAKQMVAKPSRQKSFLLLTLLAGLLALPQAQAKNSLEELQAQLLPTATDATGSSDEGPNEYFTFDETKPNTALGATGFSPPATLARQIAANAGLSTTAIALTRWLKHDSAPPVPTEKYNRKFHFGTWINDPTDATCFNSRAKVLIRDSKTQVVFKPNNKCVVDTGTWDDPYTGNRFFSTKDIQIDHVVPLRHAYQAGAWKWNYKSRCIYGNFMANNYHLLSVSGHENMSKGDKSPDSYIPPNRKVTCTYVQAWLQIKLAWGLVMFPKEASAIQDIIKSNNCDSSQFSMDRIELARQRKAMTEAIQICNKAPTTTTIGTAISSSPSFPSVAY